MRQLVDHHIRIGRLNGPGSHEFDDVSVVLSPDVFNKRVLTLELSLCQSDTSKVIQVDAGHGCVVGDETNLEFFLQWTLKHEIVDD